MEVLWASTQPLKPSQVRQELKDRYAYTTVMTILKRMVDKKLLQRSRRGRVYFYTPLKSKEEFASSCLDDLYRRLISSYGRLAIQRFHHTVKKSKINFND